MADETVKLDMDRMIERFASLGKLLGPSAYVAMLVTAQKMLRDVVSKRMSNPRRGSTDTNLGVDTGTARRSMTDVAGLDSDKVYALIGSAVDYVKTHEEGFHGTQHVRAYLRRNVALKRVVNRRSARNGMITKGSAARYKAAARKGHALTSHVRAHGRKVNIIAKHFIRDTVLEAKVPAENRIIRAMLVAARTGKVPTPNQVGA